MHSIWRPPVLFTELDEEGERKVSWLELFYDLVYVTIVIQMGNLLSHNISLVGVVRHHLLCQSLCRR
ncbi:low temperature requirement protein A [Chloroflexi bacterium TSY]|nr:low temperature requirement protein A [Chloroflexi bacterium TSY]